MMKVNLNDTIKARLTAEGAAHYIRHLERYPRFARPDPVNEGDELELQLWEAMRIFGEHLWNGCRVPFQDNVIEILPGERR